MNPAQAKDKENLVVKAMLADNISWRSFNDFREPLRTELKRKYKQENSIAVLVVREDVVEEDPVYAIGVLKLPPGKKNGSSSDYGSDDSTDVDFDEETDFDIGVMVVHVNPNAEDENDDDTPGTSNGGASNAGSSATRGKANAAKGGADGGVNDESSDESEDDDYDNSPNAFFVFSPYYL